MCSFISQTDCQLVFDFDGVLVDSREESRLNAFNTARCMVESDTSAILEFQQALFELNRIHVRSAGELVYLADWCLKQSVNTNTALSSEEFESILRGWTDITGREQEFFIRRKSLQKLLGQKWFDLHKPFQPIWDFAAARTTQLAIVTHKNQSAVLDITRHYGLLVTQEQVFAGDGATDKATNFVKLFKTFPAQTYIYIDDNLRNLAELQQKLDREREIRLIYADWGYGSEATRNAARALSIPVCSQNEFIKLVKDGKLEKSSKA